MEDSYAVELKLTKLSGPNYRYWCTQVKPHLEARAIWKVVDQGLTEVLNVNPKAYRSEVIRKTRKLIQDESWWPAEDPDEDIRAEPASLATPGASPEATEQSATVQTSADESTLSDRQIIEEAIKRAKKELLNDAAARSILAKACMADVYLRVDGLKTAHEQFAFLKSIYGPIGRQQLSAKLTEFQTYLPKKEAGIMDIYRDLNRLQLEIGMIDPKDQPSDNNKIARFFTAVRELDTQYGPLILQTEISGIELNFETLVQHFAEYERRIKASEAKGNQKTPVKEVAFEAKEGAKDKLERKRFGGECFYCHKKGHRIAECKKKKRDEKEGKKADSGPSTGPLPTPSGGQGLSPPPEHQQHANRAVEASWLATVEDSSPVLEWVIDSGCSRHMTFSRAAFTDYNALQEPVLIRTANGVAIKGVGYGTISVRIVLPNRTTRSINIRDVLHVPDLAGSLLSVTQFQDRDILVRTTLANQMLIELDDCVIGVADRRGKSYVLNTAYERADSDEFGRVVRENEVNSETWHRRFGHLNYSTLEGVEKVTTGLQGALPGYKGNNDCPVCNITKAVRVINRQTPERATMPLERIHTDIWGPFPIPGRSGAIHMITFTDDYSRKSWIYNTHNRTSLHFVFRSFKRERELESLAAGWRIQSVRCDNGPEYLRLGAEMHAKFGIKFEYTSTYWPEQNGVSERLNRALVQIARGMLHDAHLPIKLWEEAIETACYLRNRAPIGPGGLTPEEAYSGKRPHIGHLRAYGCLAYAHIPVENRANKLSDRAIRTCLVGYMPTSRQYKLYDPEKRRIIVSTAPKFNENKRLDFEWVDPAGDVVLPFEPMLPDREGGVGVLDALATAPATSTESRLEPPIEPSPVLSEWASPDSDEITEVRRELADIDINADSNANTGAFDATPGEGAPPRTVPEARTDQDLAVESADHDSNDESTIVVASPELSQPRRSGRERHAPQRFDEAYSAEASIEIPKTYEEAVSNPVHRGDWNEAIQSELSKLMALNTWKIVRRPANERRVGNKWVFTVKYTPTGLVDRFKARLVAQGFSQRWGVDYEETFSPTMRADSMRVLLAIATILGLEVRQVDIVSAYPNSKLHATVYMRIPKGLDISRIAEAQGIPRDEIALQILQSLYGLKQSGREWYIEAAKGLQELGFKPCYHDPSVFVNTDRTIIIGVYVDDMLVLGGNPLEVEKTIKGISSKWQIKDLGNVRQILGLQVSRDRDLKTLRISQEPYVQDLITKLGLNNAKPLSTPITDRESITKARKDEELTDQTRYQELIGSLIWISQRTRPDIQYAVNQLSQHCSAPVVRHWNAAIRIVRYLKGTLEYGITYQGKGIHGIRLQGYSDADYAGNIDDRRSTSGQIFFLGGGPVSWASTKQRSVSTSTTEAEYIALCEACKQGQWLRGLLRELKCTQFMSSTLATPIFSDNQAAIAISKDPIAHSRTKHIDVRYHYIRELVSSGKTVIDYIRTEDMAADALTKPLPLLAFKRCIQDLLKP
jgi:hypothetical protein